MPKELLIAVLAGLGGMFGWGFADFFAKKTIDKIGDVTTLFWGQFIGILPLLLLFFLNPDAPTFTGRQWLYLLILGVWSGLSYVPVYVAFGKGKVSLLSPLFSTFAVVVAILSAVFLGEVIPFGRQVSFLIVFMGVLLINGNPRDIWLLVTRNKKKEATIKGLPEIGLAIVLYSVWLVLFDQFISGRNWVPVLLGVRIFSTCALFIYAKATKRKIEFADKKLWKYIFLIGLFDVAAFGFESYGFSATVFTSVVVMLSGAYALPTIFFGRVFLKEKTTRLQTIGSLIVIAGIMLLAVL